MFVTLLVHVSIGIMFLRNYVLALYRVHFHLVLLSVAG